MTMDNLSEAVARIAELDAKRTQGEWLSVGAEQYAGEWWLQIERPVAPNLTCRMTSEFVDAMDIDAVFMAAAPEMAQVIRQLWDEREQHQAEMAEQCRIIAMSGEREARHRAVMEQAREALGWVKAAIGLPTRDYGKGGVLDIGLRSASEALAALDRVLGAV